MGFSPRQVDEMSLWEFMACVDGWNKAHDDGKPKPPTAEEFEEAVMRTLH